jgi:hypothetical protein
MITNPGESILLIINIKQPTFEAIYTFCKKIIYIIAFTLLHRAKAQIHHTASRLRQPSAPISAVKKTARYHRKVVLSFSFNSQIIKIELQVKQFWQPLI